MGLLVSGATLWSMALAALAAAAAIDLSRRIIPNGLAIVVAIAGLALTMLLRPGSIPISLAASLALLFGLLVLTHYDILGGGDAKLVAAAALLVPPGAIGALLLEIALAGGVLSAAYIAMRTMVARADNGRTVKLAPPSGKLELFWRKERIRIVSGRSMPYGFAVLGGIVVYVTSELFQCSYATSCLL